MKYAGTPIAYAMRQSLGKGYAWSSFQNDAVAGLIVALVALPLAMALSIAVGLPPQHGLYTAIMAGIAVPLLGGSRFQVSGPTAAFVVIVAPIVAEHGLRGLILATIMAGFVLVALGFAKLGRYIHYVPYPVTTGFTAGIAIVIGTLSLNDLLGLNIDQLHGSYLHKLGLIVHHVPTLHWPEAVVGLGALAVMLLSPRILPKLPAPVIGVACGTLFAYLLQQQGFDIATIGNRFSFTLPDGSLGHGIPPFPPVLHWPGSEGDVLFALPTLDELRVLLVPALVIAALGALESLLSATVADGMAGTRHQPNSELAAIGVGNILSGFAAGIPATGAIARTATNIQSGAKTPLAAVIHGGLVLLFVWFLAPWLSYIPMAALAALLLVVAYRMSHYRQFLRTIRVAPRSDTIVLLACFGFTVLVDMVAGVTVGVILACFLCMQRIAQLTRAEISHPAGRRHRKLLHLQLPEDVMVYHINGVVFFGTVERALERSGSILEPVKTLILDMEDVPLIDMTGLVAMKTMILDLQAKGKRLILCGAEPVTGKILDELTAASRKKIEVRDTLAEGVALVA